MANVACDQCGGPVDNTGTVCTPCLQSVMQNAGFKGLVQATSAQRKTLLQSPQPARPLLLGKATPMPVPPSKKITVEYLVPILVTVDVESGDTLEVRPCYNEGDRTEAVAFYDQIGGNKLVPAIVPPKFANLDEADAWLEANPVQTGTTEAPEVLAKAHDIARQQTLSDWF